MGTQSKITPIYARTRPSQAISTRIAHCAAAISLLLIFVISAPAQTSATTLPLLLPSAIAYDTQGNLYFADTAHHTVGEYSAAGVLTTIAGSGTQGFSGDRGPATVAALDSPASLALDSSGNLYIADSHNHRIREVSAATGTITTIAGTGVAGFSGDGSRATSAQLDLPTALVVDSSGNLYLADTNNHRIRRIAAATGIISTVAGNGVEAFTGDGGPATAASIDSPNGLALDAAGNLYLSDTHNGRIRQVNAVSGIISTIAGTRFAGGDIQSFGGDGGAATAAALALPRGLTLDAADNLYVADSANHRVRRVSASGTIATVAGQGTETFAGDGATAVAASLDAPQSVTISTYGLLTLADTGNQRIRQLDALPAPGPDIHTIPWSVATAPETLLLTGPSTTIYGSGTLSVTLTSATPATGSVTFLDTRSGATTNLGSASLIAYGAGAETATFSAASLSSGSHSIVAAYPGDGAHASTQSSALALTVFPLTIAVAPNPASILYGQAVPTLTGELTGVLPQDGGNVTAAFSTSAGDLAPAGIYPIIATLSGGAAGNYTVLPTPATLTIAQAPSLAALSVSTTNPSLGTSVTFGMHAASTTSGTPSGSMTLLDGTMQLSVVPLSGGATAFTTSSLALGAHILSVTYSGDSNFLPSTSATQNIVVSAASDFTLTPVGATSQSIPAGNAATFGFSVATIGPALSSPITLTVQGIPLGATASISPASVPPGGAVTSFTVTIQTPVAQLENPPRPPLWHSPKFPYPGVIALLLPAIGFAPRSSAGKSRQRSFPAFLVALYGMLAILTTGCGDRINVAPEAVDATSYTLTVTGTATSPSGAALQHSVNVTLQVL